MTIELGRIDRIVKSRGLYCTCGAPISETTVDCYPHGGGVPVSGFSRNQWVYFHCNKCGYDWALWKLLNKAARSWTRGVELEVIEKLMEAE